MKVKTITIRLDDELHKELKIKTINEGETIQNYVVSLIQNELQKSKHKEKE